MHNAHNNTPTETFQESAPKRPAWQQYSVCWGDVVGDGETTRLVSDNATAIAPTQMSANTQEQHRTSSLTAWRRQIHCLRLFTACTIKRRSGCPFHFHWRKRTINHYLSNHPLLRCFLPDLVPYIASVRQEKPHTHIPVLFPEPGCRTAHYAPPWICRTMQ